MRTRTEKVVVPAEAESTYEETHYGCEGCEFESTSEDEVRKHFGLTHASKGTKKVGGVEFHLFRSESDFNTFLFAKREEDSHGMFTHDGEWKVEGWYGCESTTGRCRRGCCDEWTETWRTAYYFKEKWEKEAADVETKLAEMWFLT